jgi:NAD(P)-dependent dehydrogenase (short-subunit alcohol dehydrogenase family)
MARGGLNMSDHAESGSESGHPVAFVTAGANGIGRVIARKLLNSGHRVHICDVDSSAIGNFLAENPGTTASAADISSAEEVNVAFDEFESLYDRLDVLVNNAGIAGPTARVEDVSVEDWDRTIAVDLNGAFYVTRRAVPLLKKTGGGSIVNIASSAAFFGYPLRSPYSAAKWAIIGFTKTLAMELGQQNIRVNAVCPGSVSGPRIERVIERDAEVRGMEAEEIRDTWTRQSSMRCFVSAHDVAAMIGFLVSADGTRISGQTLGVDGHTESLSNPFD